MATEHGLIQASLSAWKINIDRAERAFLHLNDEQLQKEVAPGKNRLIYLWGHLIAVHDRMLPLLEIGPRLHPELDAPFLTNPDRTAAELPSIDELKRCWSEVHGRLLSGMESFSPADWLKKHGSVSEEDFAKDPQRNRLAVFLSRTSHVAFHLGQVALIPK